MKGRKTVQRAYVVFFSDSESVDSWQENVRAKMEVKRSRVGGILDGILR